MDADRVDLVRCRRTLQAVWSAMAAAVVLYGVVLLAVVGRDADPPSDSAERLHNGFTVLGIALGGVSVWWRHRFLGAESEAPALPVARLQSSATIVWALSEAVALVGFVLGVLTRDVWEFVPFGLASIALLLLHHPVRLPYERVWGREV